LQDSFWLCVNEKGVIMVTEKKIKKEKGVIVLAVLAFCALGLKKSDRDLGTGDYCS
jgi:hypothetical protein